MNKNIVKRLIQVLLTFAIIGVVLFLSAGTLRWCQAWVFVAASVLILFINMLVLPAEVIEERGRKKENVKAWDRAIGAAGIIPYFGLYAVAGLDYRFFWSPEYSGWFHFAGLACYVLGSMLSTWAMVSNRYFSTMVRIQADRGHTVATGGPYRFVRHPGYVGFIVSGLAVPVMLGSLYACLASFISVALLVVRTHLEDKTLQAELEGYADYARRVRYRLVPRVW